MQLKLSNIYVRDIPKNVISDIYDETVTYVILIHGAVKDCLLQKFYKAPFLIPLTCHQVKTCQSIPSDQKSTIIMILGFPVSISPSLPPFHKHSPKPK